ncbi:MAG: SUMF1/EgtB/PvdO family nonheme iron enzyme [Verrucomicrobiaceae bacterium]|nr:SUMF1/EgtB/PvdO family nonheme iron enzyme [Verrucomicrobiaceae bacterium]
MKALHLALTAAVCVLLAGTAPAQTTPLPPAVLQRLAELRSAYDQYLETHVLQAHASAVTALEASYSRALERARDEATTRGDLDSVIAIKAELSRVEKKEALPPDGDDALPAAFKPLRTTFRAETSKLEQARDAKITPARQRYDTALEQYQVQLTQSQQLEAALHVKGLRTALTTQQPAATPAPKVVTEAAPAVPAPNERAGALSPTFATKDAPFVNSLGMKFVPVPGTDVLFCIHETRRQDYAAYAAEVPGLHKGWIKNSDKGVPCGAENDHPAVSMSWVDAQAFCVWLGKKEGQTYRLPTDAEWSFAVGIGREEKRSQGTTPEMLHTKVPKEYPWHGPWPPTAKDRTGNYADITRTAKIPESGPSGIPDYDDGYATTAPVMSFKPNKYGLYDMGGNMFEWVEDWFNTTQTTRTLRGASFVKSDINGLLSSARTHRPPDHHAWHDGFRIVLVLPEK